MSLSVKYWKKNCAAYIKLLDNVENYPSPYTQIIIPTLINLVKKYSKPIDKIIDIGCGEGFVTREIKSFRTNVYGCDLSPEMIDSSIKQSPNIKYWIQDIEHTKTFPDKGKFQIAISTLTFMYLEKIDTALKNIHQYLSPKGYLIITITHPCFYQQENFRWFQEEENYPYQVGNYLHQRTTIRNIADKFITHHIHRTIESYVHAFTTSGFNIIDILEPKPKKKPTNVLKKVSKIPIYAIFVLQKA